MINTLLLVLLIIFGIQVLFFIFASAFKTDKVTDLAYGLTFVIIAWFLLIKNGMFDLTRIILVIMVTLWGLRLAGYLFYRIIRIGRDKRFDGIRESFWKFAGFWTAQTIVIFVVLLSTIIFLEQTDVEWKILSGLGLAVWIIGFAIETVADKQKFSFWNNPKNKNRWIDTGLWYHSRHPNYFGEILCWTGIFIYTIPILNSWEWVSIISPISIAATIIFFSGIPTVEKRDDERYGKIKGYQRYKRTTSVLIPWFKG
jgi:steroid 5-alpha reductase family enzyme